METMQHQEWRSRQQISIPALLKSAFGVGLLLFLLSGGTPWSTSGTMNAIMGRDIPVSFGMLVLGHFVLSLIYMAIIAEAIYGLKTPTAVFAGTAIALALYGINLLCFRALGGTMHTPEFAVFLVHFMFGLFGSLMYKALSVPKPLPS